MARGCLVKRGSRSWSIVIDLPRGPDGKRRQKWVTVQGTRREAEAERNRLLAEVQSGGYSDAGRITVTAYLDRWLTDYAAGAVSARTLLRYHQIASAIAGEIGGLKLVALRAGDIQGAYTRLLAHGRKRDRGPLSTTTVLQYHHVLHEALRHAVRWGLITSNPADRVEPPRKQRAGIQVLDAETIRRLLAALDADHHRLSVPVLLALATGMRRGELLALRWEDIDLKSGHMQIRRAVEVGEKGQLAMKLPKNGHGRGVALPEFAVRALTQHRRDLAEMRTAAAEIWQEQGLVFPMPDGQLWHPDALTAAWRQWIRRHPEYPEVRFHDLRHSHATLLLLLREPAKVVSERLGHSSVAITLDIYSHVIPGLQEAAAERLHDLISGDS